MGEILNLTESVSEGFPSYFFNNNRNKIVIPWQINIPFTICFFFSFFFSFQNVDMCFYVIGTNAYFAAYIFLFRKSTERSVCFFFTNV